MSTIVNAQDSTYIKLEQFKIMNNNLSSYYDMPSLKNLNTPVNYTDIQVNYSQQRSDDYIWQEGSGHNAFNVGISSFQEKKKNVSIWGSFRYQNIKSKAVNFNETLDYDYLYPYIMSDTVGGDLNNEHYAISGGLSKKYGHTTYGLQGFFEGKQAVRNRDPRTKSISSNFNLTLSASRAITKKYNVGVAIFGDRYFQKAEVDFNSELGRPIIYHDTGLGHYNKLFANTKDDAEYLGYNYGASLHFVPKDHNGWFALAKYTSTNIKKKIKDVAFVINEANKHNLQAQIGNKITINSSSNLEVGADLLWNKLKGLEGKFHTEQSQLIELDKENLFNSTYTKLGGYLSYQHTKPSTTWTGTLRAAYSNEKENYVSPYSHQKFTYLNLTGEINVNQKISKNLLLIRARYNYANPLAAEASWNSTSSNSYRYQMLSNNFDYKNTARSLVDLSVKLAIPVKRVQTFFIGANTSYVSAYNLKQFGITSGFVF